MTDATNRHPADRLADVRAEIKRLEAEEGSLRAYLLSHPDDCTGDENVAVVFPSSRKKIDTKALAKELGEAVLRPFTQTISYEIVKLKSTTASARTIPFRRRRANKSIGNPEEE